LSIPNARAWGGTIALEAEATSALGLIGLVIGRVIGAKGFQSNSGMNTTLSYVCFFAFVIALLVAVATGAAAWFKARRFGLRGDVQAGKTALGYLVIAIVVAVVTNTVS